MKIHTNLYKRSLSETREHSIGKSVRDKKMEIGFIGDGGTENKSRLMYNIHMKLFFCWLADLLNELKQIGNILLIFKY